MAHIKRLIVIVLFERVDLLDVTGPAEVFSLLQREMDEPTGYQVVLATETLAPVMTSAGVRVLPDATFADLAHRRIDTLVVPGAVEVDKERRVRAVVEPSSVVQWVKTLAANTRRTASVCVGAHVLAAAGLLDGRRATTHWSTAQQLAEDHPAVKVDADPIFIRDRNVWTGAGLTACLDLALALVADDFGERLALRVARQLVMFLKRPSGQSQFSASLEPASTTRRMDALRHYIMSHVGQPITIADLAEQAHVSDRQLTRLFKTELNTTPAAYIESVRVEIARNRLETTDEPLGRIAEVCGFNTTDTLNRAFRRTLDTTPAEYRNRFRTLS
ncbi:GlxA family transcriptional regulator [Paraburkholderia sp. Ac-20342]|uniref:GlxA family transcriptional regulator n=1 Tax=Paraburkholderia sp. Ac-20342 TaxID=2703889 RepID=UPI001F1217F0|nr:GlxA family transcriptional regulator [Paraburkholderia sp. Ac-20342]MBN3848833.1 GlxA family transcriptional regulator [Paraburkholderia sp. Ac-20342]